MPVLVLFLLIDPREKEVTLCGPSSHPAVSLTVKCKNCTNDLKEMARQKLCDLTYFAQGKHGQFGG